MNDKLLFNYKPIVHKSNVPDETKNSWQLFVKIQRILNKNDGTGGKIKQIEYFRLLQRKYELKVYHLNK